MTAAVGYTCGSDSLSVIADVVADRVAAWVILERLGEVEAHGRGPFPCPELAVEALICKRTDVVRRATTWRSCGVRSTGYIQDLDVVVVAGPDGTAAWFLGAAPSSHDARCLLDAMLPVSGTAVIDAEIEALIDPKGPARGRLAPPAILVALTSGRSPAALSQVAAATRLGRVHARGDLVFVAVHSSDDADLLANHVRRRVPDALAGAAAVPDQAVDWVGAAALARAAAHAARRLGLTLATPTSPEVVAEMILEAAGERAATVLSCVPDNPLDRLAAYDDRSRNDLQHTLRAWLASGHDTAAAAAALHIHPNTLRYRLRRISEITGIDLSNTRQALAWNVVLSDC